MKLFRLLLNLTLISMLSACGDDDSSSYNNDGGRLKIEDVLLLPGGTCEKDRYYRIIESELIKDKNNNAWIVELHLHESGQYQIFTQKYSIAENGTNLVRYTLGSNSRSEGHWKQEGDTVSLDHGKLVFAGKIADGDLIFDLSGYEVGGHTNFLMKTTFKASEQNIPSPMACDQSIRATSYASTGAFSKYYISFDGKDFLFRFMVNRWVYDLITGRGLKSLVGDDFFCKKHAPFERHCYGRVIMTGMSSGKLTLGNGIGDVLETIPLKLRMNDNFWELSEPDGTISRFIPEYESDGMILEQTEEIFTSR